MPIYTYKARDAAGKLVKGTMEAATRDEIASRLRKMGYMTTQLNEALPGIKIESVFEKLRGISVEDMIIFNVQLSNMVGAGISLMMSLETLGRQIENKRLKQAIGDVARGVEAGDSFSQALARQPRIFSKLFVNMVRAGEASGKLDIVLARYAGFAEKQEDLRQKLKGALFYPTIVLFAGITVTLFIVTFIVPQFAEIFLKAGIRLPIPTLILYHIGLIIKHFWYSVILLFVAASFGVRHYASTKAGRIKIDTFKLKLPILGSIYRKSAISRFARTLGTLVASGVPILESLDITEDVIGNEVLAMEIANTRSSVEKGEKIAQTLKVSGEFPPDVIQMISTGEETGSLDGMLDKISDFYDMYLGYTIKKLTTVIEPLFLAIMGGMVGFIMASMLLPIFDMIKILR